MKKHRILAIGASVLIALAGIVAVGLWPAREPSFEGKPISYWLSAAQQPTPGFTFSRQSAKAPDPVLQAKSAVAAIGPEALPFVAKCASSPSVSPWQRFYARIYRTIPPILGRHLPEPKPGRLRLRTVLIAGYFQAVTERAGTNAMPMLVKLFKSANPEVRRAVVLSVGELAPLNHTAALPVFQRALRDSDMSVMIAAFRLLCQMAGAEPRAGAALADYLNEIGTNAPDWMCAEGVAATAASSISNFAANRLRPLTPSATAWDRAFAATAEWLRSPTPELRERVLAAFEDAFAVSPTVVADNVRRALENLHLTAQQEREILAPILAKGLCTSSPEFRRQSAGMLRDLGAASRSAAPLILRAFEKNPSPGSFLVLADLGPEAAPAVEMLVHVLESTSDHYAIWEITCALEKIGRGASKAIPTLLRMARENRGDIQAYALSALAQIEPNNPEILVLLLAALKAEGASDRARAARILGEMGAVVSEAVPALKQVLDEDEWLEPKLDAVRAIFRIDEKQGADLIPVLIEAIEWPEAEGYPTAAIVAQLLGQTGHAAAPAVPKLERLFNHEDERAQIAAAEALDKIDSTRRPQCVAVLREVMQHGSTGLMRFYAAKALVAMSPEAAEGAAAEIVSLLKPSVDFYRQEEAIQFLGDLGPRARSVLPQLRETLESRDWKWRRAARDAIEKIQK